MRGVNKVIIVGTLGQDPDIKATANGTQVANLSVATNESWRDKNTGQTVEKTEWHRIVMFGRLAEIAGQYLKKGAQVYFEGKNQTRKWQGNDGQDRYTTEIIAHEMQMLGASNKNKPIAAPAQATPPQAPPVDDGFDDIPF